MQFLTSGKEDFISLIFQESPSVGSSSFLILEEYHVLDAKFDQINGFNSYHYIDNVFTNKSNNNFSYSLVDLTKPLEFNDPPFESLGTCQEVEALQLPLMVMSSSHDPDEIP